DGFAISHKLRDGLSQVADYQLFREAIFWVDRTTLKEDPVMLSKTIEINGLAIFYREGGDPSRPKLVLLHGFPASSHQYRDLIPALTDHFHVVAPDYSGFGNSEMPAPSSFAYTFDNLAAVTEAFLQRVGFTRFGMYVQDYGGPVGFRVVGKHPEW